MTETGDTVTCTGCGTEYSLEMGPVELFGSEVWYADQDDPESQIIVRDGEATCYDCNTDELGDPDGQ